MVHLQLTAAVGSGVGVQQVFQQLTRPVTDGFIREVPVDDLVRNPGVVAAANHRVNAIPYVCAADPGIRTYLDLPLIAGRSAPVGRRV